MKGSTAELDELLESFVGILALIYYVEHVLSEQDRRAISLEASKCLRVTQILAKIDVKHMTSVLDHDVVVVTIANAQYVSGYTVCSA